MDFSIPDSLPSELQKEANYQNLVSEQVLFNYQYKARYVFALQKGHIHLVRYTREGNLIIFNEDSSYRYLHSINSIL